MNDSIFLAFGLAVVIAMLSVGCHLQVHRRKANKAWDAAWNAANLIERRTMLDNHPKPRSLEESLDLHEQWDSLEADEKKAHREAESARLNVTLQDLDRALLAEKAQRLNIRVRSEDTTADLKEKIKLLEARAKAARIEADLPPVQTEQA